MWWCMVWKLRPMDFIGIFVQTTAVASMPTISPWSVRPKTGLASAERSSTHRTTYMFTDTCVYMIAVICIDQSSLPNDKAVWIIRYVREIIKPLLVSTNTSTIRQMNNICSLHCKHGSGAISSYQRLDYTSIHCKIWHVYDFLFDESFICAISKTIVRSFCRYFFKAKPNWWKRFCVSRATVLWILWGNIFYV